MRLKTLEIFGFKSFADRTVVNFDQGVTCVVGPNGCGKSNISDSIRWVLGERSAKLLRGSKMEDVIFNGTDYRKSVSVAEVSLTIDNADKGLPIDYHEVTLTRKLYRSGESEYYINKTLCRLKDIQDLILDTGIGSSSYSMIEQGRIDYILNANADERRFLIEEAAGISKYKLKKEEALRKLERSEQNRLRLNDIISEVQKNIQYAERQARRAERYKEVFQELKTLELKKAFYDLSVLHDKKNEIGGGQSQYKIKLQSLEENLRALKTKQEQASLELGNILERFSKTESERYEIKARLEQAKQRLSFNGEKKSEIVNRVNHIAIELDDLQKRSAQNTRDTQLKEGEIELLAGQKSRIHESYDNAKNTLTLIEGRLRESKAELETIKIESLETAARTSKIRNEHHRLSVLFETNSSQRKKSESGASRIRKEADEWASKQSHCLTALRELEQNQAALSSKKSDIEKALSGQDDACKMLRHQRDSLALQTRQIETRLTMLREIDGNATVEFDSLTQEFGKINRSLLQRIGDLITIKPGYEWAVEAALEDRVRCLVAEDVQTAREVLSWACDRKTASLSMLINAYGGAPESLVQYPQPSAPHIDCALTDVIVIRTNYERLLEPLFLNTYVLKAADIDALTNDILPFAFRYRFLARNGLVLGFNQQIHMVNVSTGSTQESQIFQRRADLQRLEHVKETAEKNNALDVAEKELSELRNQFRQIDSDLLDLLIQKESYDSLRKGMEDRLGGFQRELELIFVETHEMEEEQEQSRNSLAALEKQMADSESEEVLLRDRQSRILRAVEAHDQQRETALHDFANIKAQYDSIETRAALLHDAVTVLRENISRDTARATALADEQAGLIERNGQIEIDNAALHDMISDHESGYVASESVLAQIKQEKDGTEKRLSDILIEIEEQLTSRRALEEELHHFEKQTMDLGYQENLIRERLTQTYRMNLSDHRAEDYAFSADETADLATARIRELREKVEKIGTVNLLAIEEYEELKTRYEFLMGQQRDLDEARDALLETIRKINKTTKTLFEETFKQVQTNFQVYYETLFQGGQAQLVLTDDTKPLESGIDVMVRPPGKKLTHITLLSGGEKALTAIALLFALFQIKPSPFSVLDEVDAPLDEANIDRFLKVLRNFLNVTQFIIVTHNRKTIAMGDSLYGVTMEEPGVSKIVSVKMEYESQEARNEASQAAAGQENLST